MSLNVAMIGCGFVSDLYIATFRNRDASLFQIVGCFDIDPKRSKLLKDAYGYKVYSSLEAAVTDPAVDIVLNLTGTSAHYLVTHAALTAGKHVYSEKPLALKLEQAEELMELATKTGRHLVCAPSSVLGPPAQTLIKAVKDRVCGDPKLIYAEMDDGMIHKIGMENWKTESGIKWPASEEMKTGCTLEHAGYALSWLVAMFGSAKRVVSTASLLVPDRGPETPEQYSTPDFSCACIEFEGGVIARLTNSIIAPHDHRLRIFCDDGHLEINEMWDFDAPVFAVPLPKTRMQRQLLKRVGYARKRRLEPKTARKKVRAKQAYNLDFSLGLAEMSKAIIADAAPQLGGAFSLHITELSLAIQHPDVYGTIYVPKSKVSPIF